MLAPEVLSGDLAIAGRNGYSDVHQVKWYQPGSIDSPMHYLWMY